MGALEAPDGRTLLWQVESNGGWRWQLAQNGGADPLGSAPLGTLGLVASGPGDTDHNWSVRLSDGASFTTPVTTIAVSADGFEGALARLTAHRRADRRPYAGDEGLPLIFNDYMNTLMADPTTEKLLPLIDAAGRAGAEIFVVDAGWYTDEQGWWDTVGGWVASTRRFPGGFDRVMDAIRDAGMTPGLWLEPEVVGVNSPVARELPDAAFYTRHGVRLVDNGRYQLDFRHPAVIERMDGVLDRLIADHGIGYVKFDYNIDPEPGTDQGADSPGAGLYDATAAYLDWIDGLHTRHPRLIVEDCASGGMRADWRTVSHFALLSTSDQQDALRCVPVAASATTLVPPEQAGVWSYPEHGMSPGVATVTLANSVLARPILSGHLDRLDETEFARLREYVAAHKRVRGSLGRLHPTWPIGLPGWEDAWAAAGLVGAEEAYLTVWRRDAASPDVLELPAARLLAGVTGDEPVRIERVFPADSSATVSLDAGTLTIALDAPSAVVLRFSRGL
nr:glycoside hydrolase family 36 protein [Leifsonia naganoensis]